MSLLVKHGARITARDRRGFTLMHHAALGGNIEALKWALQRRPRVQLEVYSNMEETPLQLAAIGGHLHAAKLFLVHGAVGDRPDQKGATSIHYAVLGGSETEEQGRVHISLLKLLLEPEWKLNVNSQDVDGKTPLMWAAERGLMATLMEILRCKPHALRTGGRNADPNMQDKQGSTAMHLAAMAGFKDIVELMANKGANMELRDNTGRTPLECLVEAEMEIMMDDMELHPSD